MNLHERVEARLVARTRATASAEGPRWLRLVLEHHLVVEQLYAEIEQASTSVERRDCLGLLSRTFRAHCVAEDAVLYPALGIGDQSQFALEAAREQRSELKLLSDLEALDPSTQDFSARLAQMRSACMDHFSKEEALWYPALIARSRVSAIRLAARYEEEFSLGMRPTPA
jgi:iron-sulfur cluster repair protein YtfE (RIC family)